MIDYDGHDVPLMFEKCAKQNSNSLGSLETCVRRIRPFSLRFFVSRGGGCDGDDGGVFVGDGDIGFDG